MNPAVIRACLSALCLIAESAHADLLLEEVIVTSSRTSLSSVEVGSAVSVINRENIESSGYLSAAELLRAQPGIAVTNTGGLGKASSLRVRGEEGYRTTVLIDGVEVSDPSGTQIGPRIEHLAIGSEIERIEILRGPQGFIFGADAGGVINFITRTGSSFAAEARVEGGSDNRHTGQAYIAGGNAYANAFVSLLDSRTGGFNATSADATGEADGYENTTLHGKFTVNFNHQWRAQWVVRDTQSIADYDNCWYSDADGNYLTTHLCQANFDQRIVKASADYQSESVSHHFAAAKSEVDNERFSQFESQGVSQGSVEKLEYVSRYKLGDGLQWLAGLDYKKEAMSTPYVAENDREAYAGFSELHVNYHQRYFLSLGLRYDDHQVFGSFLSSRVTGAWIKTFAGGNFIKSRFSYGTGFRVPSLYEQDYNVNSFQPLPPLSEELSQGGDVGLEYHLANGAEFILGLFEQHITDEIEFDLVNSSGYLQEDGVSHSRGVELSLGYPLSRFLRFDLNYTYNDTLSAADQPRIRRPKNLANLAVNATLLQEKLQLYLNARYSGDAVDLYDQTLNQYTVVDFNGRFTVTEQMSFYLRVDNLFDEKYVEAHGYNSARQKIAMGLQYCF